MFKKLSTAVFYGNYFYGICAVALSVEASSQQQLALNSLSYYLLLFTATVVYYTHAYLGESSSHHYYNERTAWYRQHAKLVQISRWIFTLTGIGCLFNMLLDHYEALFTLPLTEWCCMLFIPILGVLYYGISLTSSITFNLRNNGWLKPFVIGFVWAFTVTIFPVMYHHIETNTPFVLPIFGVWLLIKNWMFITLLCILFDIKDYAADHNRQLKTFVVRIGLRKTLFYIIIPLTIAGLISLLLFTVANHFPMWRIAINTVPFLLLLWVAYSLHARKPILYYLAVIDGLMLVKAICGIAGMLLV